jgi:hypothetical protein
MTWRLEWWNVVGRALMRPRLVAEIMLHGPLLIIAEKPANGLVEALSAAGAFPIVESTWVDAPTAFLSIKPSAVIIAEPGAPPSEASARLLGLQIATAEGPLVPAIAMAEGAQEIALPVALSADASLPVERLIARMNTSLRVRALHATVLRRIETCPTEGGMTPAAYSIPTVGCSRMRPSGANCPQLSRRPPTAANPFQSRGSPSRVSPTCARASTERECWRG